MSSALNASPPHRASSEGCAAPPPRRPTGHFRRSTYNRGPRERRVGKASPDLGYGAGLNGMVGAVSSVLLATGIATVWWRYIVLFLGVMASWASVPFIGAAAVGAAAVAASQGGIEPLGGHRGSDHRRRGGRTDRVRRWTRWGRQLLERPGKRQAGRQKIVDRGELAYEKWGRLAVFVTPAVVSAPRRCSTASSSCGTSSHHSPSLCRWHQRRTELAEWQPAIIRPATS